MCLLAEEGEAGRSGVVGGAERCVELEVAGPEGLETEVLFVQAVVVVVPAQQRLSHELATAEAA